jgi:hypothetical protein
MMRAEMGAVFLTRAIADPPSSEPWLQGAGLAPDRRWTTRGAPAAPRPFRARRPGPLAERLDADQWAAHHAGRKCKINTWALDGIDRPLGV